jgi:hypothetical protein
MGIMTITKAEALKILERAPRSEAPSKINPNLTQAQVYELVHHWVETYPYESITNDIIELRIWQVAQNKKIPKKESVS